MRRRLIVFARLPAPGRVKTRLAATIGADAALDAYRRLLDTTLRLARDAQVERLEFRFDDGGMSSSEPESLTAALQAQGWLVTPQRGDDLGERMHEALQAALGEGDLPVLIGCDCPALRVDDLDQAFAALGGDDAPAGGLRADAVFSPTEDGGYALVGLSRPAPMLFAGVAWGSAEVMATTRALAARAGLRLTALRTVWDVDVEADLLRWESERARTQAADAVRGSPEEAPPAVVEADSGGVSASSSTANSGNRANSDSIG